MQHLRLCRQQRRRREHRVSCRRTAKNSHRKPENLRRKDDQGLCKISCVRMKLDLILIHESENLNSARTAKAIKSTASSVSTAKRDIRKKADELIHLIEIQYDSSREFSPLILVSEVLTKCWPVVLKTGLVILDPALLQLNRRRHLSGKQ